MHTKLRIIAAKDAAAYFDHTNRTVREKCSVEKADAHFQTSPLIKKDSGKLIAILNPNGLAHAVALYRCKDGSFVYHDSSRKTINPTIRSYLNSHGVYEWCEAKRRLQFSHTCGYHAITFLTFAAESKFTDATTLANKFDTYLGHNPDRKAVEVVKGLFDELTPNHMIDLSMKDDGSTEKENSQHHRPRNFKKENIERLPPPDIWEKIKALIIFIFYDD